MADLGRDELLIITALSDMERDTGRAAPTVEQLAAVVGLNERATSLACTLLKDSGHIKAVGSMQSQIVRVLGLTPEGHRVARERPLRPQAPGAEAPVEAAAPVMRRTRGDDVWHRRDLPVLVETVTRLDEEIHGFVESRVVAAGLKMDHDDVMRALRSLQRTGYVTAEAFTMDGDLTVTNASEKAYRATALHPSDSELAERFLAELSRLAHTGTTEDQAKARALHDKAADLGVNILGAMLTKLMGFDA